MYIQFTSQRQLRIQASRRGISKHSKNKGITIVNLLISLTIISILSLIGTTVYHNYQTKQNLELAKLTLIHNSVQMERYFAEHGKYLRDDGNWPASIIKDKLITTSKKAAYTISFYPKEASNANQQNYCLIATPDDPNGDILYINQFGTLSTTAPSTCTAMQTGVLHKRIYRLHS